MASPLTSSSSRASLPPQAELTAGTAEAQGLGQGLALVLSWTAVGLPLAWGVLETLRKALALFE
jgi:hypothetical protein